MTIIPSAKFSNHVTQYKTIVIGHNTEALLYAYTNNYPIIFNLYQQPSAFDFFTKSIDFTKINLEPIKIDLVSFDDIKTFGYSKLDIWQRLCFCLSMAGLLLVSDKTSSLRVENNILKVFIGKSKMAKFSFEKLHIFDSENIEGIEFFEPKQQVYRTQDWVDIRSSGKHKYDYLFFEDDFVKEIFFYPSDRIDGNHEDKKDLVAISYLTKQQLNDTMYSDTYVRFFVKQKMKELGIRGMKNGKNPNYPHSSQDPFKRLSVKLENRSRDVAKTKVFVPKNDKNIIFVNETIEEILNKFEVDNTNYLLEISKKISMKDLLMR